MSDQKQHRAFRPGCRRNIVIVSEQRQTCTSSFTHQCFSLLLYSILILFKQIGFLFCPEAASHDCPLDLPFQGRASELSSRRRRGVAAEESSMSSVLIKWSVSYISQCLFIWLWFENITCSAQRWSRVGVVVDGCGLAASSIPHKHTAVCVLGRCARTRAATVNHVEWSVCF